MPFRFLLLALLLAVTTAASCPAGTTGKVTWIYDGDTIEIGNFGKVRLLGIDAPEAEDSSRDTFYKSHFEISRARLRQIAQQAKEFNIQQVKGKTVRLEFGGQRRDKYGRTLAYVYLPDGQLLNLLLLEKGLASVFRRFPFQRKDQFLQMEKSAQIARIGLWQP